jgi:hypothetical protein
MSIIPAPGRLRQKDHEFEHSLGYIVKCCLKGKKKSSVTSKNCI